jgi:hypothetical protein
MVAKKTVKSSKSKSTSKSSSRVKDLVVKKATSVKGGMSRNMYRRSQISDPCAGEE